MTDWVCPVCELPHDADTVKSMITVPEVLDLLGVEVDRNNKFTLRDERTPSCHAYDDHFFDFGTGQGGDVIDLVRELSRTDDGETLSYNKALSMLMHRALRAGREPGAVERQPVREVVDFTEQLDIAGPPWFDIYQGQRFDALNPPAACRVAEDGSLLIPHRDQDGVYGVKVRSVTGAKSAWPGSQFSKRLYDPDGWFDGRPEADVVICEGESDCWALGAHLAPPACVLALPSGAGAWKDHWADDLALASTIWLCMDNDEAGKKARSKIEAKLGYIRVKHLRVPQLFNDAREAIAAGWRPELS